MNTFPYFQRVADTLTGLDQYEIEKAVRILETARRADVFVWIVGNGGSAATASHFANDLTKVCKMRAIAIPDLTPTVTAFGNDEGWQEMFWLPFEALARGNDALVAITCGGASVNVVRAARKVSISKLIVLTGPNLESPISQVKCGALIRADHEDIRVQEDVHLAVCHGMVGELAT